MEATAGNQNDIVGLMLRQMALFRPTVVREGLKPLPHDCVTTLKCKPEANTWSCRRLLGTGPLCFELPNPLPFFEQGPMEYPAFQCPGIGPVGAGLKIRNIPKKMNFSAEDALYMLEFVIVRGIERQSWETYLAAQKDPNLIRMGFPPAVQAIQQEMNLARHCMDALIGAHVLYQHALVWEQIVRTQTLFMVDPIAMTSSAQHLIYGIYGDCCIPFFLDAKARLRNDTEVDDALSPVIGNVVQSDMQLPLLFLQQSLWEKDLRLRFLQEFWVLEHLSNRCSEAAIVPKTRAQIVERLEEAARYMPADLAEFVTSMKGRLLSPSVRERISVYCGINRLAVDQDFLRGAIAIRNDLSHGAKVDEAKLHCTELELKRLVRQALCRELARSGVSLFQEGCTDQHREAHSRDG
jgi:hypothetical protein